jgi:DNA polymerase sigma
MKELVKFFRRGTRAQFELLEEVPYSRVPIVKLRHKELGIEVDMCFNQVLGENTHWLVGADGRRHSAHRCAQL